MALVEGSAPADRTPTPLEYAVAGSMTLVAIASAWPLFFPAEFGILASVLAVAGLPASASWRRLGVSRRLVNVSVFAVAAGAGFATFSQVIPFGGHRSAGMASFISSERLAMLVLAQAFAWISAFRCWTLTTARDIPLSIVPAGSIIVISSVMLRRTALVPATAAVFLLLAVLSVALYVRAAWSGRGVLGSQPLPEQRAVPPALLLGGAAVLLSVAAAAWMGNLEAPQRWRQGLRELAILRLGALLVNWSTPPSIVPSQSVELGGEPARGDRVLFRMRARAMMLWRTASYSAYDGSAWYPERARQRLGVRLAGGWWTVPTQDPGLRAGVRASRISQQFDLQALFQGYLPAAYELKQVRSFGVKARMDAASQATLGRPILPGTVLSMVSLRKWPLAIVPVAPGAVLGERRDIHLALGRGVPPRVRRLAREICRGISDPWQKVKAIEWHLSRRCRYSLKANPPPAGRDATDWFLFVTRQGWCDHFASAAAVLCRCAGVPARLAVGYWSDEVDPEGWCIVREKHAHAWTEAFVDGYGWLEVNPSAQPLRDALSGTGGAWQRSWLALVALPHARAAWQHAAQLRLGLWAVLAGCLVLTSLATARHLRGRPPRKPRVEHGDAGHQFALRCYAWMRGWLAARGHAKPGGQTAAEYAQWLRPRIAEAGGETQTIVSLYRRAAYECRPPSRAETGQLIEATRTLARRSWRVWWAGRRSRT